MLFYSVYDVIFLSLFAHAPYRAINTDLTLTSRSLQKVRYVGAKRNDLCNEPHIALSNFKTTIKRPIMSHTVF